MSGSQASASLLTDGGDVSGAELQSGGSRTSLLYGDQPVVDVDTMFVLLSGYLVRNAHALQNNVVKSSPKCCLKGPVHRVLSSRRLGSAGFGQGARVAPHPPPCILAPRLPPVHIHLFV